MGPLAKGLSQGSNQGVSWDCHLLRVHVGKDPFPGLLVWLLTSFGSFQWLTPHVINPCGQEVMAYPSGSQNVASEPAA